MIKYRVSTDRLINSVEEEGQVTFECVRKMLFLKASTTRYYRMFVLESWHDSTSEKCVIV